MTASSAAMDTPSQESLLTSGQDTTAATGDQTAADTTTTTVSDGAATVDTTTTTADAAKTGEGEKTEDGKTDAPAGAPEAYAAFTMPEGYAIDEQMLGEFTPVLKELNLSQEAAQKVMDFAPKLIEKAIAETQTGLLTQLGLADHASWTAALKADAEIGGDKLAENLGHAKSAFTTFFSPAAQKLINGLGLGNHPEVIRGLVNVGKAISEDGFVPGGKTTGSKSAASTMYANSNMNP